MRIKISVVSHTSLVSQASGIESDGYPSGVSIRALPFAVSKMTFVSPLYCLLTQIERCKFSSNSSVSGTGRGGNESPVS